MSGSKAILHLVTGAERAATYGKGSAFISRPASAVADISNQREMPATQSEVNLRVLATSDLHANLLSYDYALNRPMYGQGLAQTASLIAEARAMIPGAILLDNGDFLQGNALADMASERRSQRPHPVIAAMNAMAYDAASLGNHEFNFGLGLLTSAIGDARFPILSANVLTKRGPNPLKDQTFAPPFAIIERKLPDQTGHLHNVKVGVFGLTPPEILQWDNRHLEGRLDARPMLETAMAWVPAIREAGADLVICLAHTGIPQGWLAEDDCHAAALARIAGIDALIAGHSHRVFPFRGANPDPGILPMEGTIGGKPVVQSGFNGSHLGVIDLTLQKSGQGWQVLASRSQAISVSEVVAGLSPGHIRKNAAVLRKAVMPDHRATLAWVRRPLGQSTVAMSTHFAQVIPVPALALKAASKIEHVRPLLEAMRPDDGTMLPILAAVAAYRTGGRGGVLNYSRLQPGSVSMRHVLDLLPFPNTLVVQKTSGAEIRDMLERSAAAFRQIIPGLQDQPLIDEAFPTFAFTVIAGLSYRFDVSQPCRYNTFGTLINPTARRVTGLSLAGKPVSDGMNFYLATNSYLTGGAQGIAKPRPSDLVLNGSTLCSSVLRDYLQAVKTVTPDLLACITGTESWGFVPLPGTSVFLDTGTAAEDHLQDIAHMRPEFTGLTESGFRRYRLHL